MYSCYNASVDADDLKRAWKLFGIYAETKNECARLNEALDTMKYAADDGLAVSDKAKAAVAGEFDSGDAMDSFFLAFNIAPRVNPVLLDRIPWRFKKYLG